MKKKILQWKKKYTVYCNFIDGLLCKEPKKCYHCDYLELYIKDLKQRFDLYEDKIKEMSKEISNGV